MKADFSVEAETRTDIGKEASRRLRHANKIPGVIYGGGKDAVSLTMPHDVMMHHLEQEAFYSHILAIKIDGKVERAVLKDVQRHPGKPKLLHLDFQRISETDKLHMHVPLHFIGEENSPGVKGGGLVSRLMNNVDVACLAKNLPEYIEVDVSGLDAGDSLHLSDIKLPEGVEIPTLAHGGDYDLPIINIHTPRGSAEEDEVEAEAAGAEAEAEKPAE